MCIVHIRCARQANLKYEFLFLCLFHCRELLLNNNLLRVLPNEIGKLFHLHILGLHGNPLGKDVLSIYNEPNGTHKLLTYMLDNLTGESSITHTHIHTLYQTAGCKQNSVISSIFLASQLQMYHHLNGLGYHWQDRTEQGQHVS